jgi:flagellar basal body-associated protein FliL
MPDSQWLDHHGKRKKYLWLVICGAAVCIAAGLFIRNNSDILLAAHAQKKEAARQAPAAPAALRQPVSDRQSPAALTKKNEQPVKQPPARGVKESPETGSMDKPVLSAVRAVSITGISCKLIDKSRPSILLSLSLVFQETRELEREILVKRDNLKIMVQKTLASKSLDDMVKDSLRKDIKSALNPLLENGAITDVEFKEFRIDKVE